MKTSLCCPQATLRTRPTPNAASSPLFLFIISFKKEFRDHHYGFMVSTDLLTIRVGHITWMPSIMSFQMDAENVKFEGKIRGHYVYRITDGLELPTRYVFKKPWTVLVFEEDEAGYGQWSLTPPGGAITYHVDLKTNKVHERSEWSTALGSRRR